MMKDRKRFGALLLAIGLCAVMAVSFAFIAAEADHDCTGEDCPICEAIAVNIRLLRTLGLALLALTAFFFLRCGQAARCRQDRQNRFFPGTLVSWKVRLDD